MNPFAVLHDNALACCGWACDRGSWIVIPFLGAQAPHLPRLAGFIDTDKECVSPFPLAIVFADQCHPVFLEPCKTGESMGHSVELGWLAAERRFESDDPVAVGYLLIRVSIIQSFNPDERRILVRIPLIIPASGPDAANRNLVG